MPLFFHKFPITSQVFHISKHSYALVNLKPIVSGHVLVVPLRRVPRLSDLPESESIDFFQTVQRVQKFISHIYCSDSINLGIQDGLAAGQSVPHVHCHIIPRYLKDGWGDGIYTALEESEGMMKKDFMIRNGWWKDVCQGMNVENDDERRPRTMGAMEKEADWLRKEMNQWMKNTGEWKQEFDIDPNSIVQEEGK